jgi:hypothetical protein
MLFPSTRADTTWTRCVVLKRLIILIIMLERSCIVKRDFMRNGTKFRLLFPIVRYNRFVICGFSTFWHNVGSNAVELLPASDGGENGHVFN